MQQAQSSSTIVSASEANHGVLREAISHALRAPSSHNSQPWRLRLRDRMLELHADTKRRLEVVDPDGRELLISCGAALFSLRVALGHAGFACKVETYPNAEGEEPLVARLQLESSAVSSQDSQLFEVLIQRQTQRAAFSPKPLPDQTTAQLSAAAEREGARLQVFSDDAARAQLAALVAEGDKLQWQDPRFRRELAAWMRPNTSTRGDGLLGYTIGLGNVLSQLAPWVIRHFDTGASQGRKDQQLMLQAPLVALLATDGDTRADWLATGQALQHVLLQAAALGVSVGFMNQPLQCESLRPRLNALLGGGYGQLLMRFGCAQEGRLSPRRPLSEVLSE